MSDERKDAFLIAFVLLALCVEILVLLHQMRVLRLPFVNFSDDSSGIILGSVLQKKKELKRRGQRSLSWYPLAHGDSIERFDTVMTGPDSWARLFIQGEGEIELEANSLIRFANESSLLKSSVVNLELRQGSVRVKA